MGSRYEDRVRENLQYMGTPSEDWRAVPIIGFQTIDVDGKDKSMPLFDFPQGYKTAPSLYRSNTQPLNCELCGKMPITTMYYIQNDKEKYTMGVGSECVTHFGEGKSGKQNERSFKIMRAIMLDTDMRNLISTINKNFREIKDIGYGRKVVEWGGISTPNSADESDFYYGVTQLKKSGDLDILYDPKSRNRDYIRMEYVVSKLPFFDYEGMKRRSDIYSDERIEKDLLSWYSRNEQTATKFFDALSKLFVAGKIDFNASEYPYFNNGEPEETSTIKQTEKEMKTEDTGIKYAGNIQIDLLQRLNDLGYKNAYFLDHTGINETDIGNAKSISIPFQYDENGEWTYLGTNIQLPSKKNVDVDYIVSKLSNKSIYKNFSDKFMSVLKSIGYGNGLTIYPTSYGIGVFVAFGNKSDSIKKIEEILDINDISYRNEYSEGRMVYRFVISKSEGNLKKIDDFVKSPKTLKMDKNIEQNESLLNYVLNYLPSGSIANKTKYNTYEDIEAIRNIMISILQNEGDMPYSISAIAELVKEAERRYELSKGIEVEQEHKETLEEIASGEITVDEAIEKTAEDHLKENPEYYTELEESGVETPKSNYSDNIKKLKNQLGLLENILTVDDSKLAYVVLRINTGGISSTDVRVYGYIIGDYIYTERGIYKSRNANKSKAKTDHAKFKSMIYESLKNKIISAISSNERHIKSEELLNSLPKIYAKDVSIGDEIRILYVSQDKILGAASFKVTNVDGDYVDGTLTSFDGEIPYESESNSSLIGEEIKEVIRTYGYGEIQTNKMNDEANAEFDNAKAQFIERLGFYEKSKDKTALRVMEMLVSEMEKQLEFVPSRVIEYVNIVKGLPKSPYRVAMSFLTNYDYVNESTKSVAKWMNENDLNPYEIVGIETYKAPKVKLFSRSYSDKTFMDIHSAFANEDGTLRINLMGTHFDGDVAVTTDAHAMLVTNKTTTDGKPNGTYCWTKKCWQSHPSGSIEDKYPDWRSVIAEPGFWVNLNAQAILSWIETCENGGVLNNVTISRVAIRTDIIDDNNEAFEIGFQLLLLRDTIEAMLRLGHSELKIGLSAPSRAAIIAPSKDFANWASKEGSFRELTKVNTDFALIMPVLLGGFSGVDESPYNWDEPKSTKYFLPTYDISTNCAIHPITLKHTCFDEQKREKDNLEAKIKELEAKVAEQKAVDVVVPEPVAEPQVDVEQTETVVIDEDAEAKAKAASARIRILKLKKLKKK